MFIEDENNPLIYYPEFFDINRSEKMFAYFKNNIKWAHDEYNFNGTIVKSPRLVSMYSSTGDKDYTYSGQTKKSYKYTKSIDYIANEIETFLNLEKGYFNGCLLNYYRNGEDSISYHNDNEKDMDDNGIIAVLSIGEERTFYIKHNKTGQTIRTKLKDCSLSIMNPICQRQWKHAILKEKDKSERISLTFRKFV